MKTAIVSVFFLFFATITGSANISISSDDENVIIAIYQGINDDDQFEFTDMSKNTIVFDEVSDDVEFDLWEDDNLGYKLKITWEEKLIDVLDDDDNPTGEKKPIKIIIKIEEV